MISRAWQPALRVRGLRLDQAARLMLQPVAPPGGPRRVFICVADHFEPAWKGASRTVQQTRVARWVQQWPRLAESFRDSNGRAIQHTFFYPMEQYEPRLLNQLAGLCRQGLGEVEIHLHHDHDCADNLRETLERFKERLFCNHGLLRRDDQGRIRFGFIHGNWALNNSRPDGRWCGVDGELRVLAAAGCYADFTFPSAPASNQPRTMNSIYYAPLSGPSAGAHDRGPLASTGQSPPPDSLLMIQGPLGVDWSRRKWGCLPRLENGDLRASCPPSLERLRSWIRAGVGVRGRPDWIFIKLHTHGAVEANADVLLGEPARRFHQAMADAADSDPSFQYFYVTAYEMAQLVHQAEAGVQEPELG